MKKVVIFNVGGALSAYAEFDDKKSIIDLGSNASFSPVDDFLIPLAEKGKFANGNLTNNSGKYLIDQLFLSHLDKDHISDYNKFRDVFHPDYMTCPNDNNNQENIFKVNRELLGGENEIREIVLRDMMGRGTSDSRRPNIPISSMNPLISLTPELSIHYIQPEICETNVDLVSGYPNNISLALFIKVENKTMLFTGDLLKNGMEYLINNNVEFKNILENDGVDYLIAPHHGLQTSFSESLFQTMLGNKTRLNIISEKVRSAESTENRSDVDSRYNNSDYSTGDNSLNKYGVKTSLGHIVIDFEARENQITQIQDNDSLLAEFI